MRLLPGAGDGVAMNPYPLTRGTTVGSRSFPSWPTFPCRAKAWALAALLNGFRALPHVEWRPLESGIFVNNLLFIVGCLDFFLPVLIRFLNKHKSAVYGLHYDWSSLLLLL